MWIKMAYDTRASQKKNRISDNLLSYSIQFYVLYLSVFPYVCVTQKDRHFFPLCLGCVRDFASVLENILWVNLKFIPVPSER